MTAALSRMLADAPSDGEQLEEHHGRVADRIHPALRRIDPTRRHLGDPVAGTLGPVKHLDVEPESAGLERRKDPLGDLRCERLEATLRIVDTTQHENPDQAVEDFPHRLPIPRLMELDL